MLKRSIKLTWYLHLVRLELTVFLFNNLRHMDCLLFGLLLQMIVRIVYFVSPLEHSIKPRMSDHIGVFPRLCSKYTLSDFLHLNDWLQSGHYALICISHAILQLFNLHFRFGSYQFSPELHLLYHGFNPFSFALCQSLFITCSSS